MFMIVTSNLINHDNEWSEDRKKRATTFFESDCEHKPTFRKTLELRSEFDHEKQENYVIWELKNFINLFF